MTADPLDFPAADGDNRVHAPSADGTQHRFIMVRADRPLPLDTGHGLDRVHLSDRTEPLLNALLAELTDAERDEGAIQAMAARIDGQTCVEATHDLDGYGRVTICFEYDPVIAEVFATVRTDQGLAASFHWKPEQSFTRPVDDDGLDDRELTDAEIDAALAAGADDPVARRWLERTRGNHDPVADALEREDDD